MIGQEWGAGPSIQRGLRIQKKEDLSLLARQVKGVIILKGKGYGSVPRQEELQCLLDSWCYSETVLWS